MKKKYSIKSKFLSINLILISISFFATSQEDFNAGYIINNKSDTIKGFIDQNSDNFYKCKFKFGNNSDIKTFEPYEIKGYRFLNGKYFISKKINLVNSFDNSKNMSETEISKKKQYYNDLGISDTGARVDNVFMQYLLNGIIKIYYLKDKKGEDHYFIEKDSLIDITPEKTVISEGGYSSEEVNDKRSKRNILYLMQDCPAMKNEILNSSIYYDDLIKLGRDYHNNMCKSYNCVTYEQEVKPHKIKFCVNIGTGFSGMNLQYTEIADPKPLSEITALEQFGFKDNFFIYFGGSLHFRNMFSTVEKFSFKIGIDYWKNNYTSSYRGDFSEFMSGSKVTSMTCSSDNIDLKFKAIYNFSTKLSSPYIEGGLAFLIASAKSQIVLEETSNSIFIINRNPSTSSIGVFLGLGYELPIFNKTNKIFMGINYEYCFILSNTSISLGYEF